MRYDEFRAAWDRALTESRMGTFGSPSEMIDTSALGRRYTVSVEPLGGQDAEPFFVTARLAWRWSALHAARTATTEEDMLSAVIGRENVDDIRSEPPWLRVDVRLRASLPWGKPVPMPSSESLARWIGEVSGRLERIEPLVPEETVRETPDGLLEVLAWRGAPRLECATNAKGELQLHSVALESWQALALPRRWDDPDKADPDPAWQLGDLFARLRAALLGWMESLDHLTAP
jgi:hypothetical protein